MPSFFTNSEPRALAANGPVIPVHIWLPAFERQRLQEAHVPVHGMVQVGALFDSGASFTSIAPRVARELGLVPQGATQMFTAGHPAWISLYDVALDIGQAIGVQSVVIDPIRVGEAPLAGQTQIECLIGRDVLAMGLFTYVGFAGSFGFSV